MCDSAVTPRIWTYWESPKEQGIPAIIQACIESMRRHAGTDHVVVMTPTTAAHYTSLLDARWRLIPDPAHRADYLRSRVLYEHGGLWLDADTILLGSIVPVFERLRVSDVVGLLNRDGNPSISVIAARPRAGSVARWLEAQQRLLEASDFMVTGWNSIGSELLGSCLQRDRFASLDPATVKPIPWWSARLLLSEMQSPWLLLPHNAIALCLYREVHVALAALSTTELMHANHLVCRVLRLSLGVYRRRDWWRPLDLVGPCERVLLQLGRLLSRLRRLLSADRWSHHFVGKP